jgi:hypothetical protein
MLVFLIKTQDNITLEDHVHLWKGLTSLNNGLVRYENPTIQLTYQNRSEFISTFQSVVSKFKFEKVWKFFIYKPRKQIFAKFKSNLGR